MGLKKKEERNYAQILYTNEHLTAKEVAKRVGVTQKTIGKWIKEGNWDKLRKSLLITKQQQISLFYNQLDALNKAIGESEQGYPTAQQANSISQITAAIQKLEVETSVGQTVEVARDFINYVREYDLDAAKSITAHFDGYIQSKINK